MHYVMPDDRTATVFDPEDETFGPIMAAIQAGDFEHAAKLLLAIDREPMTNDEIVVAVKNYCADLAEANKAEDAKVAGERGWTAENAAHVASLLNQASGEFTPFGLFRFMDEQTGSWRVGYKTDDGREWFHILRQMRNTREGGLFETLGK